MGPRALLRASPIDVSDDYNVDDGHNEGNADESDDHDGDVQKGGDKGNADD